MEKDTVLNNFINTMEKTKIAIVIPLFGYWREVKDNPLTLDVLKTTLDRAYSNVHEVYTIFVAEAPRLPKPIAHHVTARGQAGDSIGISVPAGSSYSHYVEEGVGCALKETKSSFVIVLNPWVMLQHNSVDNLIERANRGDSAKIICGCDVRGLLSPGQFAEDGTFQTPKEERAISFDFMGMARYAAEMFPFDQIYKTHWFIERDTWQETFSKGYDSIVSQRIPIFPFEIDWSLYETKEDFEEDRQYFLKKWKFNPGIEFS